MLEKVDEKNGKFFKIRKIVYLYSSRIFLIYSNIKPVLQFGDIFTNIGIFWET